MDIQQLFFEVHAVLGKTELPFAAYSELQIGDIIVLDQKAGMPLDIKVEDEVLFQGNPGLYEIYRAMRVR